MKLLVCAQVLLLVLIFSCARTLALAQNESQIAAALSQAQQQLAATPAAPAVRAEVRNLGFALLREQRYAAASEIFGSLLRVAPRDFWGLYGAGLAAFNQQRLDEAETFVSAAQSEGETILASASQSAESKANLVEALVLRAVIRAVKGDSQMPLTLLQRAVELRPDHFDAQFSLGRAYYGAGNPAQAAQAFQRAAALRPDDARTQFFLATMLEKSGDDAGAQTAYRALVKLRPANAEGHAGLGALLVKAGGTAMAEGIAELTEAVRLNSDHYEARLTLGRTLVNQKRAADALPHLLRAVALAPDNPEPHFQLAQAYLRLGRKPEAEEQFAIVKRIHENRRQVAAPDSAPKPQK